MAEAYALAAFRHAGVPMQRIGPAIGVLESELGIEHALASQRLYTDGAEVLYDYADLRQVSFAADGYARLIRLPQCRVADVTNA